MGEHREVGGSGGVVHFRDKGVPQSIRVRRPTEMCRYVLASDARFLAPSAFI